jgi:hypothetical protein
VRLVDKDGDAFVDSQRIRELANENFANIIRHRLTPYLQENYPFIEPGKFPELLKIDVSDDITIEIADSTIAKLESGFTPDQAKEAIKRSMRSDSDGGLTGAHKASVSEVVSGNYVNPAMAHAGELVRIINEAAREYIEVYINAKNNVVDPAVRPRHISDILGLKR